MARSRPQTVVGLEIDSSHVYAVQTRVNGAIAIERAASAALEPGLMREGEVADPEALSGALRELFGSSKLDKRVRVGVANQRVAVRTIDLPPVDDPKDLASVVRFQAQEHVPMPLDQAVLEHQSLGLVETPDGPRTRVVLVAARRDMIDRLLGALRGAGLRPAGIDLSAFAMIRALHDGPPDAEELVLYVGVGGVTNLALAQGSRCLFTRVIAGGVEQIAADLAARAELTLDHARGWLAHVGLGEPVEEVEGQAEIVSAARAALSDGVRRVADEARNSIDFYRSQSAIGELAGVVLTGVAADLPGFDAALGEQLGLSVRAGVVGEARPGARGDVDPGRLTVAAGLTVEERAA